MEARIARIAKKVWGMTMEAYCNTIFEFDVLFLVRDPLRKVPLDDLVPHGPVFVRFR